MSKLASVLFILFAAHSFSQYDWQWSELTPMPFATSNNAVCEAHVGGNTFVYSFGGIDTSKIYSGIHKRSFKYDVQNNLWSEIASLPDSLGKIASASSFVNGKIYILGGYHVMSNGNEISSDRVHVYDPTVDQYLPDGSPIPVPIDDHVQCVYKDSLIFVITGWSQTTNVSNVQIYNTHTDNWTIGTPVPNNAYYKTFGASGFIIGDTIYYHGGAAGFNFSARTYLRKGYIDPLDPTQITWFPHEIAPGLPGYRSACSARGNTIFWVGGSSVSYNYNGIAYNGSGGVSPSARILHWNYELDGYTDTNTEPFGVMDLRGIANLGNDQWIICGGMDSTQTVTARTFLLQNSLIAIPELSSDFQVYDYDDKFVVKLSKIQTAVLFDPQGRRIREYNSNQEIEIKKLDLLKGLYILRIGEATIKLLN